MRTCPCSIFQAREEQIFEPSGSLCIRLICNVCGAVLDSKVVSAAAAEPRPQSGEPRPAYGTHGGER